MPRGKPIGKKEREEQVRKKVNRPAFRGNNPRTMTTVSGYDQYAPDPDDKVMEIGVAYNDVVLAKVFPEDRKIGIDKHGVIRVPHSTVIYLAHKDIPYVWHSQDHYHCLMRVKGKKTFVSVKVDKALFK